MRTTMGGHPCTMPLEARDHSPTLGTCMKSSAVHDTFFIHERFIYEP